MLTGLHATISWIHLAACKLVAIDFLDECNNAWASADIGIQFGLPRLISEPASHSISNSCCEWACRKHRTRANLVQKGDQKPSHVGCKGWSVIPKCLEYVDYSKIFVLPVSHMLLHGVVPGFWKYLLQKVPRGQPRPACVLTGKTQRIMQARAKEVVYTADFGGPPRYPLLYLDSGSCDPCIQFIAC